MAYQRQLATAFNKQDTDAQSLLSNILASDKSAREPMYRAWCQHLLSKDVQRSVHGAMLVWYAQTYASCPLTGDFTFQQGLYHVKCLDTFRSTLSPQDANYALAADCMALHAPGDFMELALCSGMDDDSVFARPAGQEQLSVDLFARPFAPPRAHTRSYLEHVFEDRATRTVAYIALARVIISYASMARQSADARGGDAVPLAAMSEERKKVQWFVDFYNVVLDVAPPSSMVIRSLQGHFLLFMSHLPGGETDSFARSVETLQSRLAAADQGPVRLSGADAGRLARPPLLSPRSQRRPLLDDGVDAVVKSMRRNRTGSFSVADEATMGVSVLDTSASMGVSGKMVLAAGATDGREFFGGQELGIDRRLAPDRAAADGDAAAAGGGGGGATAAGGGGGVERPHSARYRREVMREVDVKTVFAEVPDIWLQVDPVVDRLSHMHAGSRIYDEVLISGAPGKLQLSRSALTWVGDPIASAVASSKPGLVASPRPSAASAPAPRLEIDLDTITRYTFSRIGQSTAYALVVHTDQSNQFFPIYDGEVQELALALCDVTGKEPFDHRAFVRQVIDDQLAKRRMAVLKKLTETYENETWVIDNTRVLIDVLRNLTNDLRTQNIYDLERLFHSCRLNKEVLKETLHRIRRIWHDAKDESVRLRVLDVMDRLVDRALMHTGDANFNYAFAWLSRVEEHLDPYTSSESLKLVLRLRKRLDNFKRQNIQAIPESQYATFFDSLTDLREYQAQYAMDRELGIA